MSLVSEHITDAHILGAAQAMKNCIKSGNKILIAGNGGSAAQASHFTAELVGRYRLPREPYPAIALTGDQSSITCIANDFGYETVYERLVRSIGKKGDLFIGLTTSGKSQNIISAFGTAHRMGLHSMLITGKGGDSNIRASISLIVPTNDAAFIQEGTQAIIHAISERLEEII